MDKTLAQQQTSTKNGTSWPSRVALFCVCSGVLFGRSRPKQQLRTGFSVRIDYGRLGVRLFLPAAIIAKNIFAVA
jgi:hypothetical protein